MINRYNLKRILLILKVIEIPAMRQSFSNSCRLFLQQLNGRYNFASCDPFVVFFAFDKNNIITKQLFKSNYESYKHFYLRKLAL